MLKALQTVLCGSLLLGLSVTTSAQSPPQLSGVVRDTSGAVLPGVTVTVTGAALVVPRTVVTNEHGGYELDSLPAGRYVVTAALIGFEPKTREVDVDGGRGDARSDARGLLVLREGDGDRHEDGRCRYPVDTHCRDGASRAGRSSSWESRRSKASPAVVPTVTISQHTGAAQVTIRGIGTNSTVVGADPSSTVHLDGVYLGRPVMVFMDFLNVERVEVLRGPQGTLYGRNSVGGTINIVTDSRPTRSRRAFGSPPATTTSSAPKAPSAARSSRTR